MAPWTALRGWPLQRKAYGLLLASTLIPLVLVTSLVLERERDMVRSANVALLQARVDAVGQTLEAMHRSYSGMALRSAREPRIQAFLGDLAARPGMPAAVTQDLLAHQGSDPTIRGIGLLDTSGRVVAATEPGLVGAELAYREYFKRAVAGADISPDLYVSIPVTGAIPTIAYAVAVRSPAGRVIGVYALWVRARALWDVMSAANGMAGRDSFFILFDGDGVRIGHSTSADLVFHPAAPLAPEVLARMLGERRFQGKTADLLAEVVPFPLAETQRSGREEFRRLSPSNREWNLGVARTFPALGWTLVAQIPEREVEVTTWSVLRRIAPGILVGLVVALVGGAILIRRLVRPIHMLAAAAAALERGDPQGEAAHAALEPAAPDELGNLTRAFRSMAATLRERDQRIQARNRDLKQVLDNVGQGFLAMDLAGAISEERSAVVEQWFGQVRDGEPVWGYLGRLDADFAARTEVAWRGLVAGGAAVEQALLRMPSPLVRGEHTFELVYRAVGPAGQLERVILVISDVTVALATELTERKLEAELRHAQKLESVGLLASGIAHEINTPVQFVSDSCRFLQDGIQALGVLLSRYQATLRPAAQAAGVPAPSLAEIEAAEEEADLPYLLENLPKAAESAIDGLQRVATIVRAMKEFAHPDTKEMTSVDLNQAIESTLIISRNEYKYVADVTTDLGVLPRVVCHAGEVNQVFLNILVNAAHAIAERTAQGGGRGRIAVGTRLDGDAVLVSIRDSGGGIPAAIQDRVFDPFFTTKGVGKGTGQGLWIARSVICEKHGGQLTFETELGKGTTFFVRLPLERSGAVAPAAPAS